MNIDENRHPLSEPAQWVGAYSYLQCRMRGLFERVPVFTARPRGARKRAADVRLERFDSWYDSIGRGPKLAP